MNAYSGTFLAALVMFSVPALVNIGFSDICANEVTNLIVVPGATAVGIMAWRWLQGGVNFWGKRATDSPIGGQTSKSS